jgi:hypothetical protein
VHALTYILGDNADVNKMSPGNLAVCMSPNLLREPPETKGSNQLADITYVNGVISTLVEQYDHLKHLEPNLDASEPAKQVKTSFKVHPTIGELKAKKATGASGVHHPDTDMDVQKKLAKAMLQGK